VTVHVVVVNWNGRVTTLRCLRNLQETLPEGAVVHLVDNGSTDGSVGEIRAEFPEVLLHENAANLGFSAGANVGIRAALDEGAEWVLLQNNDATLRESTVPAFLEAAGRHPEAGLFGGRIYHNEEEDLLWCCGVSMGWAPNLSRLRGHMRRGEGRHLDEEEVESLTGCGLFVHRSVWERIGLLDEQWFVYVEDADFCARARKAGFRCIYVPDAVLEHFGSGSTGGGYSKVRKYLTAYGSVLYLKRHGGLSLWVGFLFLDVLLWFPLLFLAALRGRGGAVLAKGRGILHGLSGRPLDRSVVGS